MDIARTLMAVGAALFLAGLAWPWLSRLPLGRLPGDLRLDLGSTTLYLPLATCALLSVALSLIVWLTRR
ncbi:MAG: DUF2905 domain-containing protein [Paracoccaceae bacterium]